MESNVIPTPICLTSEFSVESKSRHLTPIPGPAQAQTPLGSLADEAHAVSRTHCEDATGYMSKWSERDLFMRRTLRFERTRESMQLVTG